MTDTRDPRIQSRVSLLGLSSDWCVDYASANLQTFVGVDAAAVVGRPINTCFDRALVHELRNQVQRVSRDSDDRAVFAADINGHRVDVEVAAGEQGFDLIFEPRFEGNLPSADGLVRRLLEAASSEGASLMLARRLLAMLRATTGYDQVGLALRDAAGGGEVIAESTLGSTPSLMGVRFDERVPASGTLANVCKPTLIADTTDQGCALLQDASFIAHAGMPRLGIFALACASRCASLASAGVGATLTVPVCWRGESLGTLLFRHREPMLPSARIRAASLLLVRLYALVLRADADQTSRNVASSTRPSSR